MANRRGFLAATGLAVAGIIGVKAAAAAIRVHVGDTLHSSTGAWLGSPNRFSYRFQRRQPGTPWSAVQDSTSNAYTLTFRDAGYAFRVQVTAYNDGQSQPASSTPTGIVKP